MAASPSPTEIAEAAERHLVKLAVQYYVSGRCSALAGLMPVTGNLLHHALEMLVKAGLVDAWLRGSANLPSDPLKTLRDKYGHRLIKLWEALKAEYPTENLQTFDATVSALDHFETLRYPESVISQGAAMFLNWDAPPATPPLKVSTYIPTYNLVVHEIDNIVIRLFEICSYNPKAFFIGIREPGRTALTEHNPFADRWT